MKQFVKQTAFFGVLLTMLPLSMSYRLLALVLPTDSLLAAYSQLLSLLPGKTGCYLRAGFYRLTLTHCSPDAVISFLTLFSQQDIEIASGVYIGPQCNIGKCKIGTNSLLGSGVHIMSGKSQHNFSDLNTPIKDQGGHFEKVEVGANCWLGNGTLVMAKIGDNCIIGSGSVVIDEIPANSIAAGNPAKVIRERS